MKGPYKWKTQKETWAGDTVPNTRKYTWAIGPTEVLAGAGNEVKNLNAAYWKGFKDGQK